MVDTKHAIASEKFQLDKSADKYSQNEYIYIEASKVANNVKKVYKSNINPFVCKIKQVWELLSSFIP